MVDLQKLNVATMRETYHTQSPFNHTSVLPVHKGNCPGCMAWVPYPSPLPSFMWCNYVHHWMGQWIWAPQGFHASPDVYICRIDNITINIVQKHQFIDNSILLDDSIEASFWHTMDYIACCGNNGIVFNPKKFHFTEDEVDFAGFCVMKDSIKPSNRMTEAILHFLTPKTNVRSWFRHVNQVSYTFPKLR